MSSADRSEMQPPATRRRFSSVVDEAFYVYDKLLYWLYVRQRGGRARRFAERLATLIGRDRLGPVKQNECRALIAEARLDWKAASRFRRREIQSMERARSLAGTEKPVARRAILRAFTASDVADRYDLLSIALRNDGRLRSALQALESSEAICRRHRVPFDGGDIRDEIVAELSGGPPLGCSSEPG